jgi:hypothetical protein
MALQSNITTDSGVSVQNAYSRVEKVKMTSKQSISFELASYINSEVNTAFSSKGYLSKYELEGSNPIKQAYLHLKTLPEFADALDV